MGEMVGDLCRVTLIAPRVRLDVALPSTVPVASLLPTLLWHCGEQLAEEGVPQGGWSLQRAAEPVLDTAASLAGLGIRDGDILHMRPRHDAMPAPVFDDAVDAIATALREHARRWSPAHTRVAALAVAGALLAVGAILLAEAGLAGHIRAAVAAAAAIAAVAGAGAASRAFGDASGATMLGIGALPYAFLAGLNAIPSGPGDARFLTGATAVLITAAAATAAVGSGITETETSATGGGTPAQSLGKATLLIGAVASGFLAVGCSVLAQFTSGTGAAAAAVALALALSPAIAPLAYRLAGLPRPTVAASSAELRQRSEPVNAGEMTRRSLAADRTVAALLAATGVVVIGGSLIMLHGGGWGAEVLAALAAILLLLRARIFVGLVQRAVLIGSALAVIAGFAILAGPHLSAAVSLAMLGVLVAGVAAAFAVAGAPDCRQPLSLGRAADLAELLLTIATVPLALQVLHVFSLVRSLGG